MTYLNEKHRARFELAAKNILKANYALLSALYLLTVADIRGTSPKVWSSWKAKLLQDLYLAARDVLGGHGKQARFGATEAIDRLLGIADEKQPRTRIVRPVHWSVA